MVSSLIQKRKVGLAKQLATSSFDDLSCMKSSNDLRHTRMVWNSYSYSMLHLLTNLDALRKSLPFTPGGRHPRSHGVLSVETRLDAGNSPLSRCPVLSILHKPCFQFLLINLSMSFTPQWLGSMRNSCIHSLLLTLGNDFGTTSYYFSFFGE